MIERLDGRTIDEWKALADLLAEALRECWMDVSNETGYADKMVADALQQYDGTVCDV